MPAPSFDVSKIRLGSSAFGPNETPVTTRGADILGIEKWMDDITPNQYGNVETYRTYRRKRCRLVRNVSGVSLPGKCLVRFKDATMGTQIDGLTHTKGQGYYAVLDEHLTTLRDKDIGWVTLEGPTLVLTHTAGNASNVIAVGDKVIAATAATSQNTSTGGRVEVFSIDASTQVNQTANLNGLANAVGIAMTAMTTGQTNSNLLVDVQQHR